MGTTFTGTANSEHVPIGLVAHNLNNTLAIRNYSYSTTTAAPMSVTTATELDINDYEELLWTENNSFSTLIPRHLKGYAGVVTTPTSDYSDNNKHIKHVWGHPRLDKCVQRFLLNSAIGKDLIHYNYSPSNAYIGCQNAPIVDLNAGTSLNIVQANRMLSADTFSQLTYDTGDVKHQTSTVIGNNCRSGASETYSRKLESDISYNNKGGFTVGPIQPQLHVGILATPAISHAATASTKIDFQQTLAYFACDTYIEFEEVDVSSMFTLNTIIPKQNSLQMVSDLQAVNKDNAYGMRLKRASYFLKKGRVTRSEENIPMEITKTHFANL